MSLHICVDIPLHWGKKRIIGAIIELKPGDPIVDLLINGNTLFQKDDKGRDFHSSVMVVYTFCI